MYEKPPPFGSYYVTLSVSGWIDVFTNHAYCEILIDNLNHCIDTKNLYVYEYVLMPSFITLIASSKKKHISTILREFKNGTAKQVLKSIAENPEEKRKEWMMRLFHYYSNRYQQDAEHHFWQFGNHPVVLDSNELFTHHISTVVNMPVTNRMVDDPRHYFYSSAHPQQRVKLAPWQ
jgi:REP element-mobilizing transposase RayT